MRLPTQRASEIGQLLPHQWVPPDLRKVSWTYAYRLNKLFLLVPLQKRQAVRARYL